jgi:hypothetical protein
MHKVNLLPLCPSVKRINPQGEELFHVKFRYVKEGVSLRQLVFLDSFW